MRTEFILVLESLCLPACREWTIKFYEAIQNKKEEEGWHYLNQIFEWVEENFEIQINNPNIDQEMQMQELHGFLTILYEYQQTLESRATTLYLQELNKASKNS